MEVSAIVLAAGRGRRLGLGVPKPLVELVSCPIIIYSLKVLSRHPSIKEIVLVVNPKNRLKIRRAIQQYRIPKITRLVLGGRQRQDSVRKGLEAISPESELVLIHDAVRPFINRMMLNSVIEKAKKNGAAILGVPVKATVKEITISRSQLFVRSTLNRDNLYEIQTPQVFRRNFILGAYRRFGNTSATDDAMLVEKLGVPVSVVLGSYDNIKITTPQDLYVAQAILKDKRYKFS
ncbi:MAG: 2-C-methyl-D-erythritol 4-phosphate cytidylyltransferase [Candidatus Omnitrophica bacterium]|nr:2-C-methyl-D-erythritol 4-phosphate cytidylyltransferase [Candidatus Omnitrophota bacterium]